jgi:alpha-L-fucosidase
MRTREFPKKIFFFLPLILIAGIVVISAQVSARGETGPKPKANQAAFKEWQDMHFGMFIHWGPVSLKGTEISWSRGGERRGIEGKGEVPVEIYDNLYKRFNPVEFNAEEWVAIARAAGMKYMILTAKHCDGFCLWPSKVNDYNIGRSPFKRDICGELAEAAHNADMRIGWYYSPMDWRDPDCRTERNAAYVARMQGHLRELLGSCGRIDRLWFDTDGGPAPWDQEKTYAIVRSLQPQIIINNRLDMGSMDDYNAQRIGPQADYATPEQRVGEFDIEKPWETCLTLGTQWSWKPDDKIKSIEDCVRILVQCATGGGNLLLNVGPMPSGEIEPRQAEVLKGIGAWLSRYGESIYGTRGGPVRNGAWGGMTNKGNVVYVHILEWDGDSVKLPALKAKIVESKVLTGGEAKIEQAADGIVIRMPVGSQDKLDTIVKLELERPGRAK